MVVVAVVPRVLPVIPVGDVVTVVVVVVTIGGGAIILLLKRWVWDERSVAPPVCVPADADAWAPADTDVTTGGWETSKTGWAGWTGWG